jgi:hypothetical protein
MVVHSVIPATQEAKAGGSQVQGQPELHSKFQASLCWVTRSCLKNQNKQNV